MLDKAVYVAYDNAMRISNRDPHKLFDLSKHPLLLSMEEVGDILRCSEQAVRKRLDKGELAYVRDGRHIRIPREELRRYLEEHLVIGPARGGTGKGDAS